MEWISVKDRLPELNIDVLVASYGKGDLSNKIFIEVASLESYTVRKLRNDLEFVDMKYESVDDVTHWMPLPDPPNQ